MPLTTYTSGEVLTASSLNSNLTAAGGLQFIKSQTIGTGVSSVTVTGAFSATYDAYKIIITGGVGSTDADISLSLGATAAGYYAGYSRVTYSTGAAATASNNGSSSWTRSGSSTTDVLFSHVDLFNPFATKRTMINGFNAFAGAAFSGGAMGGFLDNATSYTAFTYTTSAGTMTGGTISVYGYAK
jgi:hypothetical protein